MTTIASIPAVKVKELLDSLGYLGAFTVSYGTTDYSFDAPVFQIGYPDETRNNVTDSSSIIAVQQFGVNGNQPYNHDVNMYIHLWTPTNSTDNYLFYMARMNEIMTGLRTNWRDSAGDVQLLSTDFMEGGQTDSGRTVFYASIRVICDL